MKWKKLRATKKITLSTLKAFAKRNENNIFTRTDSRFDGMSDMVENVKGEWKKSSLIESRYYQSGIDGVYTVGGSRDYFKIYEDDNYFGINVYNSCGDSTLAIKK